MSQAGILDFQNSDPQILTQIDTNNGSAIPIANQLNLLTENATVIFEASGNTITQDFGLSNLVLGSDLPSLNVGTGNVGLGNDVLNSLTNGEGNVAIGDLAAQDITTGSNNVAIGKNSLLNITGSVQNTGIGHSTLAALTTSTGSNTAIGYASLVSLSTGTENIALGANSGDSLSGSDSSNILIGSAGVTGDNNRIRIGTQGTLDGQQDETFIAGIVGSSVTGNFVNISSSGQLGEVSSASIGQTITGNTGGALSPSAGNWNIYTDNTNLLFAGSGNTLTLDFASTSNLIMGRLGTATVSGSSNVGVGFLALNNIGSGSENSAVGVTSQQNITTGGQNSTLGTLTLAQAATASSNVAVGYSALANFTGTGVTNNVAIGAYALTSSSTGTQNVAIGPGVVGTSAGSAYTGAESSNILIYNTGVIGESNKIRIGTQGSSAGQQDTTYIVGPILATTNGTGGAPAYSFSSAPTNGMSTDGTNTYISGNTGATLTVGFNIVLNGGTNNISQGFLLTGIDTKTANFTTAYDKYLYLVDVTTGSAAITAQLVSSPITGQVYTFKDSTGASATYTITISGTDSGKTIDGSNTYTITANYGAVSLIYNGTQWNAI